MPRGTLMTVLLFLLVATAFALYWVYQVDTAKCTGCGNCLYCCPQNAISMAGPDAYIDPELCDACGICVNYCPWNAIYKTWWTGIEDVHSSPRIAVSPNPFSGILSVSGLSQNQTVSVFDATGRLVLSSTASDSDLLLDLSSSRTGLYILTVDGTVLQSISLVR